MGFWGYFSHENDSVEDEWYDFLRMYIKKYHPELDFENIENNDLIFDIAEKEKMKVAIFMIKYLRGMDNERNNQIGLINKVVLLNKDKKFPAKLFPKFPEKLRKKACILIKKELKRGPSGWEEENLEDRISALHKEASLYNCETLVKKGRKGPSESATLFNVGKKKKGVDGNYWIVREASNGTKRWVKDK